MNRCVGCDNVERSLDADLLCSWCVERRECFRKGEQAGRASAFRECAEEARKREANADERACGMGHNHEAETAWIAKSSAFEGMAEWAESKAGTT